MSTPRTSGHRSPGHRHPCREPPPRTPRPAPSVSARAPSPPSALVSAIGVAAFCWPLLAGPAPRSARTRRTRRGSSPRLLAMLVAVVAATVAE